MRINLDWQPFFDACRAGMTPEERIRVCGEIAEARLETDRFVDFCETHLGYLDEVADEFFGSEAARRRGPREGVVALPGITRSASSRISSSTASRRPGGKSRPAAYPSSRHETHRQLVVGPSRAGSQRRPLGRGRRPPSLMFPTAGGDAEEIERFLVIDTVADYLTDGRLKVYSCDSVAGRAMLGQEGTPEHRMRVAQPIPGFRRLRGRPLDTGRL